MDAPEFRMAITHALAHTHEPGGDIAILWQDKKTPVAVQLAPKVMASATGLALPIVRLLRTLQTRPGAGSFITTTAPPTEACLGMARMCKIDHVAYLEGGVLKKVITGRTGTTTSHIRMTRGSFPNVTRPDGSWVVWTNSPSAWGAMLRTWFGKQASVPGSICHAADQLTPQKAPSIVSFASSGLEYLGLKSLVRDQTVLDNVFMMLAWEMVAQVSGFQSDLKGGVSAVADARSDSFAGQNIGSLLVDEHGNILAWGFNTNKHNPTRHGEINLIGSYMASEGVSALPARGTIYTTLEPCEMCSGAICRTVPDGTDFRVLYGQQDVNVYQTALQRKVKPRIVMSGSKAALATADMIKAGSGKTASAKLVDELRAAQNTAIRDHQRFTATTAFLKKESTYTRFFAGARPQWWLYLWDHLASKLPPPTVKPGAEPQDKSADKNPRVGMAGDLADPAAVKLNNQLDIIYQLVEQFMKTVAAQAKAAT